MGEASVRPSTPGVQAEPHSTDSADEQPTIRASPLEPSPGLDFKILQWNCNGLSRKIKEVTDFMDKRRILIAALQETKLTNRNPISCSSSYSIIRQDRERDKGGGLAFLIHDSVNFRPLSLTSNDDHLELQGIAVRSGEDEIEILNVYIPPTAACRLGYRPSIEFLMEGDNRVILGDLNAHHDSWHSELENDARGNLLADEIDNTNYCVVNERHPTRITADCRSSPDLSIVSPDLVAFTTWHADIALNSDHIPITVKITKSPDFISAEARTFVNFRKTDWARFEEMTELQFSHLTPPSTTSEGERNIRKILIDAKNRCIPAGRITKMRPNFPPEACRLADRRDAIRRENAADPRLRQLSAEINALVSAHCKDLWLRHLEESDKGSKRLWSTIKNLSNPRRSGRPTLTFEGGTPLDSQKCCAALNRQFVEHPARPNRDHRCIRRKIRSLSHTQDVEITPEDVSKAIKAAKASTAIGPDGLAMIMLKHVGEKGLTYMAETFSLCVNSLKIPDMWKLGKIIPIPKPGKPINMGSSYRPITLLSPVIKVLANHP